MDYTRFNLEMPFPNHHVPSSTLKMQQASNDLDRNLAWCPATQKQHIPSGLIKKLANSNLRHEIAKRNPFHRINGIVLIIKDEESSTNTQTHTSTSTRGIGIIRLGGWCCNTRAGVSFYTEFENREPTTLIYGGGPPLMYRETIWWNVPTWRCLLPAIHHRDLMSKDVEMEVWWWPSGGVEWKWPLCE